MTIENPPRLWAFAVRGAIHAAPEEAPLLASVHQGWGASKPQAYVREDVAETETTALCRERDALAARVDALRTALSAIERQTRGASDEADARIAWDVAGDAILADNEAKAAGKGVG